DAVAIAEGLARQQLVAAHDRLATAEIDDDVAIFDALDDAVDDLADAVAIFLVLALALGVAHLLDDDLLGRLRGDAAEIDGRKLVLDEIAELGGRIAALRVSEVDLDGVVLDLVHHFEKAHEPDLAGLGIDAGTDLVLRAIARAGRLLDRLGHRL